MLRYISTFLLFIGIIFLFTFCNQKKEYSEYHLKPHFSPNESDYYKADSIAGHFHVPNAERDFKWAEHPSGKIIMKTNNLGFRNNENTEIHKPEGLKRIIITGDSHTDGVMYNSESVASQLKNLLEDQNPENQFEVLNAGNGYYGPQNFLGVYKKIKHLQPDIFVTIVYTGNDFLDGIRIEVENERMQNPKRPHGYYDKLWEIDGLYSGFTGQYLNQLKFIDTYPEYIDTVLHIMQYNLSEINKLCAKNNTRFIVVLQTAKIDTEPKTDQERIDEVFEMMGFNETHIETNRSLSTSLANWLKQENIQHIDLHEAFLQSEQELFWKADYHVNHKGHYLMAQQLAKSGFIVID